MRFKNHLLIVLVMIFFCVVLSGCISDQNSGKGTLNLTSKPSGAEVYLDNQFRGSTPCTIPDLNPGMYNVELRLKGYPIWSTDVVIFSGTYQFNALLSPVSQLTIQPSLEISPQIPQSTTLSPKVTIQASKDLMIIGNINSFTGTCIGSNSVLLILYGPGYYSQGVILNRPKTNSVGSWSYIWNPGSSIQSGSYTMVVFDANNITSDRVDFSVVGGGEVTIAANKYSAAQGEPLTFSGRCTTGAHNVNLILYGPERYSSGVELGSLSVMADKTWSFKFTLDNSMPTGYYTMNVYDVPKTSSGSMQFTVGFTSGS
jgi:hypothetical protein